MGAGDAQSKTMQSAAALSRAMSSMSKSVQSLARVTDRSPAALPAAAAADEPRPIAAAASTISAARPNPLLGTFFYNKRFEIKRELGRGAFGEIYECFDHHRQHVVAAKMELSKQERPQLRIEYGKYMLLKKVEGVATLFWFNENVPVDGKLRNILVISKLGASLEDVMQSRAAKRLDIHEVMEIGVKALRILRNVHDVGIVHRDVKPENFLVGLENPSQLFLVDFGLSKKIIHDGRHVQFRRDKDITGTPRYASINNHLGYEQSRVDDLMSLLFMLIYLAKGALPWQGKRFANTREKYNAIKDDKLELMSNGKLFDGLPDAFQKFSYLIGKTSFDEKPDYNTAIRLFETPHKRTYASADSAYKRSSISHA
jgi:serine/threonine protein kinase